MAIGVGSVVINLAAASGTVPAIMGEVVAANGPDWNVLWQSGELALAVPTAGLYEWVPVTPSMRPAVRKATAGVAPHPDLVGVVIEQTATHFLIRTPNGYQYVVTTSTISYLDVQH